MLCASRKNCLNPGPGHHGRGWSIFSSTSRLTPGNMLLRGSKHCKRTRSSEHVHGRRAWGRPALQHHRRRHRSRSRADHPPHRSCTPEEVAIEHLQNVSPLAAKYTTGHAGVAQKLNSRPCKFPVHGCPTWCRTRLIDTAFPLSLHLEQSSRASTRLAHMCSKSSFPTKGLPAISTWSLIPLECSRSDESRCEDRRPLPCASCLVETRDRAQNLRRGRWPLRHFGYRAADDLPRRLKE